MSDTIARLERWHASMCGCDWHEHYGVKIDTLDNPGWAFEIDLADYPTTPPSFEPITEGSDDKTFMNCWI